jgi:endo-1,4-beta-xylanase
MAVTLAAGACAGRDGPVGGDGAVGPSPTTLGVDDCTAVLEACTLRGAGDSAGVVVGTAVAPDRLDDPAYARLVAEEFSSLTPENHMKWPLVHPEPGVWVFEPADRLVAFAEEHDLAVRGHTLVWGQDVGNGVPDWVAAIDDPDELQAVVDDHIATLVGRYAGRVDRWDVVNEPLEILGPELDGNHFLEVLGPDYIAAAFEAAHRADPDARLFLNEHSVEVVPAKADALVALVERLVAEGVPIHGVGLQAHQFSGQPPEPGVIEALVTRFTALGLEVAITELDLPLSEDGDLAAQADGYRQIVRECLAAGCTEITVWGVYDGATWLDDFLGRARTSPLLFDYDFEPKPAYTAVIGELIASTAPSGSPGGG